MDNAGRRPIKGCIPIYTNIEESTDNKLNIKLYPNPVNDILYFSFDEFFHSNINIYVYDIYGKMILKEILYKSQTRFDLNFINFPSGLYVVQLITGQDSHTWKVIKK